MASTPFPRACQLFATSLTPLPAAAPLALLRRADDGLDRPALPVFPPAAVRMRGCTRRWWPPARCCTATWPATSTSIRPSIRSRCSWAAPSPTTSRAARGSASAGAYDEINLNCGCPSERVQRGAFGACLMAEPALVADCVKAMRDAVSIPVTVKHRIGIDRNEDYGFVRDFVGHAARGRLRACSSSMRAMPGSRVSARRRTANVPPLRYEVVPAGATFRAPVRAQRRPDLAGAGGRPLQQLAGVMLGRAAYHDPYLLAAVDAQLFGDARPVPPSRAQVVSAMSAYLERQAGAGVPPRAILRHMLGLFHGQHGARNWRRLLSDPDFVAREGAQALACDRRGPAQPAPCREPHVPGPPALPRCGGRGRSALPGPCPA
jgi:tRNA-dihydrouridine synthase A